VASHDRVPFISGDNFHLAKPRDTLNNSAAFLQVRARCDETGTIVRETGEAASLAVLGRQSFDTKSYMPTKLEATPIPGVMLVIPDILADARGFFTEVYRADRFKQLGLPEIFLQWNQSHSVKNVVRGLHFQWDPPMAKLMRVTLGEAYLVAVDIRKGSPTLGKHFGAIVSAENKKMIYAPAGFARGFCVLSERADIQYLCTGIYNPKTESGILWSDAALGIQWPVTNPILSPKDEKAQTLAEWLAQPESDCFKC
jgi:dTDP-4-dehydrorhamnose 3,5-epimerase